MNVYNYTPIISEGNNYSPEITHELTSKGNTGVSLDPPQYNSPKLKMGITLKGKNGNFQICDENW